MNAVSGRILASLVPPLAFFAVTFILYGKSLRHDFMATWDDSLYVLNNELIRTISIENLGKIFITPIGGNVAPLHILSYQLDFFMWGLNPAGYHLSNILLHGLAACMLYLFVRKITGNKPAAFISTLFFIVHPLNVENVAWISERKTLLSTVFFFSSLNCYLAFREKESKRFYIFSILFGLLGILSKTSVVVLPLVLAAYELFLKHSSRKMITLIPYFLISLAGAALAIAGHLHQNVIEAGSWSPRMLFSVVYPTMIPVFWKYFLLVLAPLNLCCYYDTTLYYSFADPVVAVSALACILVFMAVLFRGSDQTRFWFLWFWICLLPTSNILPLPVYFADRYMYLPSAGIWVLITMLIADFAKKLGRERSSFVYAGFTTLLIFAYAILAYERVDVWRNDQTLWEDAAQKSPNIYKVHLNLGVAFENAGRLADAEKEYSRAFNLYRSPEAYENLNIVREKIRIMNSSP